MSNSISANATAMRNIKATNLCRIGTSNTADYISPRGYYYTFSAVDDYMAMQLLALDQARLRCEDAVRYIMSTDLYRGHLKVTCKYLYAPRVNAGSAMPVCNAMGRAITSNMTADELMSFATMADVMDETIGPDIMKLNNCVHTEVGRMRVSNQTAMAKILSAHIFTLIAKNILSRCNEVQHGSHYHLCLDPYDAGKRASAYEVGYRDLDRLMDANQRIIIDLCEGRSFSVPYTAEMQTGVTAICQKMCSVVTIYNASRDSGIDLAANSGKTSPTVAKTASTLKSTRPESPRASAPATTASRCSAPDPNSLASLFASKGWQVRS